MTQHTLTGEKPPPKTETADVGKELKGDPVTSMCMHRRPGACYVLGSVGEKLACPCNLFVTYNWAAVERFGESARKHGITGRLAGHSGKYVDYHDLMMLTQGRGKKK